MSTLSVVKQASDSGLTSIVYELNPGSSVVNKATMIGYRNSNSEAVYGALKASGTYNQMYVIPFFTNAGSVNWDDKTISASTFTLRAGSKGAGRTVAFNIYASTSAPIKALTYPTLDSNKFISIGSVSATIPAENGDVTFNINTTNLLNNFKNGRYYLYLASNNYSYDSGKEYNADYCSIKKLTLNITYDTSGPSVTIGKSFAFGNSASINIVNGKGANISWQLYNPSATKLGGYSAGYIDMSTAQVDSDNDTLSYTYSYNRVYQFTGYASPAKGRVKLEYNSKTTYYDFSLTLPSIPKLTITNVYRINTNKTKDIVNGTGVHMTIKAEFPQLGDVNINYLIKPTSVTLTQSGTIGNMTATSVDAKDLGIPTNKGDEITVSATYVSSATGKETKVQAIVSLPGGSPPLHIHGSGDRIGIGAFAGSSKTIQLGSGWSIDNPGVFVIRANYSNSFTEAYNYIYPKTGIWSAVAIDGPLRVNQRTHNTVGEAGLTEKDFYKDPGLIIHKGDLRFGTDEYFHHKPGDILSWGNDAPSTSATDYSAYLDMWQAFLTTGGTDLHLMIPIYKSLAWVNGVNVKVGTSTDKTSSDPFYVKGLFRSNGKYGLAESYDEAQPAGYCYSYTTRDKNSVSAIYGKVIKESNSVHIVIRFANPLRGLNNAPAVFTPSSYKITFT